ncbi:Qat anti-phage system TatD family nuclease QatD [Deinococcus radiodurans]|jgi:Mg-dependent DNase|uniref:Uncharacterized protein n=1 Tax=Deinococcus radiodurans (strain ATCC 13939 / DSM 20539 / JCM 16871 / CCUG 27074 / LMG 4051 / NBRC 15346 / NCIMB 9279 / VKM B-1422 / R1) TaxID=243230 RepID=Q9RZH8_DEIRA|nr:Qat anti-phage system TatD family nuclease QatD [Deinococcus radiodurans]AAF12677.1 conserved hypothetical protein [Deinococcus radiodurans R1 = ATCC 13939 = DSM 20539]ANC73337.1 hydrolase TatD [Deinococcus radiodurans R1 = ATCC 13939 = DSM 20539]QEM73373.1 TatD family deoxyribonuclease [Deinococcus radiodurans]QIP30737.1 TatD family hydrolase [Deinococcus radiodurans]QIP33642.1 TatD family hydrolase [Deinococcus radiodurans]
MIDFHVHLDLYPDPVAVARACEERQLTVLSVTTTPAAWRGTLALAAGRPHVWTALGFHPEVVSERAADLPWFDRYLPETRFVGEVGLDGSPSLRGTWTQQFAVFQHILRRCEDHGGRILSIHSRRAESEVLNCLEANPRSGTPILHWYSGSVTELRRAISLGCWFSVGPTMVRTQKGAALIRSMPRDRVLTETDGPFLELDGQAALPWDVKSVVEGLSKIWQIPASEVERIVKENVSRLLGTVR